MFVEGSGWGATIVPLLTISDLVSSFRLLNHWLLVAQLLLRSVYGAIMLEGWCSAIPNEAHRIVKLIDYMYIPSRTSMSIKAGPLQSKKSESDECIYLQLYSMHLVGDSATNRLTVTAPAITASCYHLSANL